MSEQNVETPKNDELDLELQESKASRGSTRLVIGLLIFAGVFFAMINSMVDGGAYLYTVDEVYAAQVDGALKTGRKVRIKGLVMHGSYKNDKGSSEHRFNVEGEQHRVPVYFKGPIPDVFKEGAEVVATGTFDKTGVLTATEVTAKCPSKYEESNISEDTRKQMNLDGQRKTRM